MLRGVVGRAVRNGQQSGDRRHVDDAPAALRQHARAECLCQQEGRHQIDFQDAPILRARECFGRCDETDPGIIHKYIGAAPASLYFGCEPPDRGFVGDVADEVERLGTALAHRSGSICRRAKIAEGQAVTPLGQELRRALPNALRGSGNNCDM